MPSDPVELDLPMPPRELSPNHRGHYYKVAPIRKAYRQECQVLAQNWMQHSGADFPLAPPIVAEVTFTFPNRRRRDQDNALAALKACWDGLVDARLLEDDKLPDFRVVAQEEYRKGVSGVRVRLRSDP